MPYSKETFAIIYAFKQILWTARSIKELSTSGHIKTIHNQPLHQLYLVRRPTHICLETSGPELHSGTATYQRTDGCESLKPRICTSVRVNEKCHHWELICLTNLFCEILGFRRRVTEAFALLGNCAAYVGSCFPMFPNNLSVLSSTVNLYKKDILNGMLYTFM
jgi:hypothetical protein